MYGCESWTIKKTEHRIDAFELWCWRRLLRVPWNARKSNHSILKEISPGCSLVGLMLKLKLQYFGHLMWRADSFGKTLILEKIEGRRRRGWQKMRWLDGITDSMNMGLGNFGSWWWTGGPGVLRFMESQRVRHDWVNELNWTELNWTKTHQYFYLLLSNIDLNLHPNFKNIIYGKPCVWGSWHAEPSLLSSDPQIAADLITTCFSVLGLSASSFPLEVLMETQEHLPKKNMHTCPTAQERNNVKTEKDLRNGDKNSKKQEKIGTRYYFTQKIKVKFKSCHVDSTLEIMKTTLSLCDLSPKIS